MERAESQTTAPGKVALVTGGAVRLGRGITEALARRGCKVAIHYHGSEEAARSLESELLGSGAEVAAFRADLGDRAQAVRLFDEIDARFGGLDLLVNNAALFERVPFLEIRPEQFERMWQVNAMAPFVCSQLAVPRMRSRGGGSIVNIADVAGERPFPGHTHYCMSKAAVILLTRSLAIELAPEIRVNAVSPGAILFPENYPQAKQEAVLRRIPMGRTGTVDELAETVAFLLLGPGFVTGQVLAVDGGRSARL